MTITSAEQRLLGRDPHLVALRLVFDGDALGEAARDLTNAAVAQVAIRRWRYKPRGSVLAAVEVTLPDGSTRWLLLAGYAGAMLAKIDKDRRSAGPAAVVGPDGSWILAPASTDRAIRVERALASDDADARALRCLAYNPRRRMVLWDRRSAPGAEHGRVLKVYSRETRRMPRGAIRDLAEHGAPIPTPLASSGPSVHASAMVPGRVADPAVDGPVVASALARLHAAPGSSSTPSWSRGDLAARISRATASVIHILPGLTDDARALDRRLALLLPRTDLGPTGTLHGDFSPDQVLVQDGSVHLVDLDESATGPLSWDAATWLAAQAANGSPAPVALPGTDAVPAMVAAALALRLVEPFRRRRPGWERITAGLVDAAHEVLDGTGVSRLQVSA